MYEPDLEWLNQPFQKRLNIKTCVVGCGMHNVSEAHTLNRIIRVTDQGWELEADPRHAEMIIEDMGL